MLQAYCLSRPCIDVIKYGFAHEILSIDEDDHIVVETYFGGLDCVFQADGG